MPLNSYDTLRAICLQIKNTLPINMWRGALDEHYPHWRLAGETSAFCNIVEEILGRAIAEHFNYHLFTWNGRRQAHRFAFY